ncbi:Coiled-coil and C2 domain-containing protein 1-like [Armadillidium nasatum]|uniref:Coiled-coil and C2 domain-containing protein 1-like n=1 Tax=Armadillidium nasatum TaxID=96803 RepID=A0A5N5T1E3_9CRUS|nr:Coiled-coil and C2 domain-containing protein 1-like [Armadillidium nasatum]
MQLEPIKWDDMSILANYQTPPGYPPIPIGGSSQGPASTTSPTSSNSTPLPQNSKTNSEEPQVKPVSRPAPDPPAGTVPPKSVPPSVPKGQAPAAPPRAKINVRKNPQSMVERQLSVLKRRHDQFKVAALEAKKKGEIEQAKEYVRNFKGIEQLIGATEGGLPVDMNTVPIPPQEKLGCENVNIDFEVIDKEDCVFGPPTSDADAALTYSKLEEDLIAQIKMCAHTREHFKALGDVASANRFEQLILHTKKDLDAVRAAFRRGDTPPRFHYENRTFTLIQCNTDINDSDCEVSIIRGINFNVSNPTDVDTYVKIEFPYPSDAPPQERTNVVKDTNNPEFNHKVVFSIDRKARALSRVFKRHSIKCQIITKGGWFHRDNVLGNVKIPLVSLETKCTLHDSFDLIDDKKKMIGGKLEVKVRVRNPILSKQLEKVTEKWIIIDGF